MGQWICFRLKGHDDRCNSLLYSANEDETGTDFLTDRYLVSGTKSHYGQEDNKVSEHNNAVNWVKMDGSHIEQVIDVVSRAYVDREPLMYTKKIDYDDFRKFTGAVVRGAAGNGLSTVGLHGDTVVSVVISEDLKQIETGLYGRPDLTKILEIEESSDLSKNLRTIFALVGVIDQKFLNSRDVLPGKIPKGRFFHIALTAVREGYGKRGLCSANVGENLEIARASGFEEAVQEASNEHAQKILSRLGFKSIAEVRYNEWKFGESFPFAKVEQVTKQPSIKLMSLKL